MQECSSSNGGSTSCQLSHKADALADQECNQGLWQLKYTDLLQRKEGEAASTVCHMWVCQCNSNPLLQLALPAFFRICMIYSLYYTIPAKSTYNIFWNSLSFVISCIFKKKLILPNTLKQELKLNKPEAACSVQYFLNHHASVSHLLPPMTRKKILTKTIECILKTKILMKNMWIKYVKEKSQTIFYESAVPGMHIPCTWGQNRLQWAVKVKLHFLHV